MTNFIHLPVVVAAAVVMAGVVVDAGGEWFGVATATTKAKVALGGQKSHIQSGGKSKTGACFGCLACHGSSASFFSSFFSSFCFFCFFPPFSLQLLAGSSGGVSSLFLGSIRQNSPFSENFRPISLTP